MITSKAWRNKTTTVELKGFEDVLEKLQEAGKSIDVDGRKCFEEAAETLFDELTEKAEKAGLSERLVGEIYEDWDEIPNSNIWRYACGWKKQKPKMNPLPDSYKVMFYNYGTPSVRKTKNGGQRVQIDGKWVTLDRNRGKESAHPIGSHGFIKKAKVAAASKNRKLYKEFLTKILGEVKR